jgi:hypothetical protein
VPTCSGLKFTPTRPPSTWLEQTTQVAQAGDKEAMQRAGKSLEVLDLLGKSGAMWSLAAHHHSDSPGRPPNEAKKVRMDPEGSLQECGGNHSGALVFSTKLGKVALDCFVNHQVPWARKLVQDGDEQERAAPQQSLELYAQLQREKSRPATVGQLLERIDELAKQLK